MPTNINYYSNGEAITEDTLNRPLQDIEANLDEIFINGVPDWNSSTTYEANSFVQVNGTIYRAINSNLNKEPTSNPSNWKLYEGNRQATLTERGTVTISDSTTSTSSITAASSKAVNQVKADIQPSLIPVGSIVMWSGSIANIPAGWALCDGTNGTPNLQNRFVVGAGDSYAVGATGGADSVTLTESQIPAHNHVASSGNAGSHNHTGSTDSDSHNHSGSTSSDSHNHSFSLYNFGSGQNKPSSYNATNHDTNYSTSSDTHSHSFTTNWDSHSHSLNINNNGSHNHTITVEDTGGNGSHENRPPYYALALIMKL